MKTTSRPSNAPALMRSILPPPCSSAGVPSTVICSTKARRESGAVRERSPPLPREGSHLHGHGLRQALQGGLERQRGGGSHLGDEVVAAGVPQPGQRVVLAEEGEAERVLRGRSAPVGAESGAELVARLHGPGGAGQVPAGEEAGQGIVRLVLRVRQLGTAPDVAAQRAQTRSVQIYTLACPLLQRLQRGGGAALRRLLRLHEASGAPILS